MSKKYLFIFLTATTSTAIAIVVGWIIGYTINGLYMPAWAAVGGLLGTIGGAEIGRSRGWIEARWDRILWVAPMCGYVICGGIAASNSVSSLLVASAAALGSGFGALISKYLMEFFNYDRPPSILR